MDHFVVACVVVSVTDCFASVRLAATTHNQSLWCIRGDSGSGRLHLERRGSVRDDQRLPVIPEEIDPLRRTFDICSAGHRRQPGLPAAHIRMSSSGTSTECIGPPQQAWPLRGSFEPPSIYTSARHVDGSVRMKIDRRERVHRKEELDADIRCCGAEMCVAEGYVG